jgi:curved DNA-binding protein CbpA
VPQVLDIEQSVLLLELEPPFDKRAVQLARRRMAKRWHPDIAPPGRQHEHERHLKAINEAADQLERLAEDSRGGKVSRTAVKVSAAAARKARAEEGQRNYEAEQRARAHAADLWITYLSLPLFRVVLPASGERTLLQFQVAGEGPNPQISP